MIAGKQLDHVKGGDLFSPRAWNDVVDEINRLSRFTIVGGEGYDLPGGQGVIPARPEWCYAKITAQSGSTFDWTEQYPAAAGGWTAAARAGTYSFDPAYEINDNTPATFPFYAILRRSATSGLWLFSIDACT